MDISISLTPELLGLVQAKVQSGRYTSTSDVIQEALRMLERADRREADHREEWRRAWVEGVASSDAGKLDFAELRDAARRRMMGP